MLLPIIRRQFPSAALCVLFICMLMFTGAVPASAYARLSQAIENSKAAIANTFTYPVDTSQIAWRNDYNGHTPLPNNWSYCYNVAYNVPYHAGQDYGFPATLTKNGKWDNNTPVAAIANGTVLYSSQKGSGGTTTYPGGVVIVQHTLQDGTQIYSMYAHLDPTKILVATNATVTMGQEIASGLIPQVSVDKKTGSVFDNTHLHWEMRYDYDLSEIKQAPNYKQSCAGVPGPGYTYNTNDALAHPDNFQAIIGVNKDGSYIYKMYHWTNPEQFVSTHQSTTYFDDFSSYTPGQPPTGYLLRGASGATPTVQEVGGTGPAYRLLSFPYIGGQYWDSWALKDGLTLQAPYVVTVKLNFQTSGDRGGLTIAWNDTNWNRIDIQPNIYWQDVEFRISYTGPNPSSPVVTGSALNPGGLPMQVGTDYWLQVAATSNGPGQGQVIVSWSTDGTNFTPVVTATGLADVSGLAGMSTAGPNLPNVYFDDFLAQEN